MVKQNINIMNWAQQAFAEPLTDYIAKDNYDLSGFVGIEPNYTSWTARSTRCLSA